MKGKSGYYKNSKGGEVLELNYTPIIGVTNFRWSATGGSASAPSYRIDWGDGTHENIIIGNTSTNTFHTYTSTDNVTIKLKALAGMSLSDIFAFWLYQGGVFTDILDLSVLKDVSSVVFDTSLANVTEFALKSSDISNLAAYNLDTCTKITLDFDEMSTGSLEIRYAAICDTLELDPNVLLSNNVSVRIRDTNISNFTGYANPLNDFDAMNLVNNNMQLNVCNFTNVGTGIYVQDNGMSAANVDAFIISVEASATLNNVQNKLLIISGNAAPTAASATALAALTDPVGLNWTVTTD